LAVCAFLKANCTETIQLFVYCDTLNDIRVVPLSVAAQLGTDRFVRLDPSSRATAKIDRF